MHALPFDFQLSTRIVFREGAVQQLGGLARELGGDRVLVVSDRGVVAAGQTQYGLDALAGEGLQTRLFDQLHENPTTEDVDRGLTVAREFEPDLIVGLGGGSSMDCAKGVNFLLTNGGCMQDYWGVGKAKQAMLPMIAVPTTAGTGSEAQSFALISDAATHVKMACGDKKAACRVALLDPRLTLTQPPRITALTGIDAMAHALETLVSTKRNSISQVFSREAWQLLSFSFGRVLEEPDDLSARSGMQLGACLAGMAIENSMLGAAHGLANPLTAEFGIVHGQAVGLMLPHVIRFNGAEVERIYGELLQRTGPLPTNGESATECLARFLAEQVARAGLPGRLSDCGVPAERLGPLADAAARQWTSSFNPRPVDSGILRKIYEDAL